MTSDVWESGYSHGDSSGGGGGLLTFFCWKGGLIREKGLIWEGGLIEDLQLGFDSESLVVAYRRRLYLVHNKHNRADV